MSKSLFSIEIEQSAIALLLQYPETYVDMGFLNSKDFSKQNSPIFAVISNIIENKGRPDEIIVAEKLKSLGITLDGLEVGDYCSSLKIRPVDKRNAESLAKEIKLMTLKRTIVENAAKVQKEIMSDGKDAPKTAKEMIDITDRYLGESLISLTGDQKEPVNLLEVLPDLIEEYGNDLDTSTDIIMPHKSFRENIGDLKCQNLYAIIARAGASKSTFLLDLMRKIPEANPTKADELKLLYLDSEMVVADAILRYIAGSINVPYWLVDSRKWRYDPVYAPKIRKELDRIRNQKNKNLYFEQIGNKSGLELEKYIKRFYLNKVGRGNPFMVFYDYLKISEGDKTDKNSQEYQIAYTKSSILKEVAEYCNCPIFTAIQANRSGIVTGKNASDIQDNEGQGSMSDRLNWLVAYMGILRKRTHDEMMDDSTPEYKAASHKLITTKTRYLGEKGPSFLDYVKVGTGKDVSYRPNFINFDISNFAVTDRGTFSEQLILTGKNKVPLTKTSESQRPF